LAEPHNGSRTIRIDPVTRIEGHAKITIHLDDAGRVAEARFHVAEFRGFEKFCEGRSFREMPAITSRICGICPVSHLLCSAKTGDGILAVEIPRAAVLLRRVMNLAQIMQSHALSFFHLSAPDLYLGFGGDPAARNLFGLVQQQPELARAGIRLRQVGQQIIEALGGRRIHSVWAVPGGVVAPLSAETRDQLLAMLPDALKTARAILDDFKRKLPSFTAEIESFGDFPTLFLGLVSPDGSIEHYDGVLRMVDESGAVVADRLDPAEYSTFLGEAVEDWSYLKFPYYRPRGYPGGVYRVGPLARLNVAQRCGTPLADAELVEFKQHGDGAVLSSFHFHYARLVEILYAVERMKDLLAEPEVLSRRVIAEAGVNRNEAVGCSEAPRGTLFHHYKVDDDGLLVWVDLLIATGQNNLAMNRTIRQVAERFLDARGVSEEALNRIEAGIRAYDPCLSCSTHAVGRMPMIVQLYDAAGVLIDERRRNSDGTVHG
jgi:NAD-reducing hydrogenase large subunit